MSQEFLIFIGYSDDASAEAEAIRELEPLLQDTLQRLNKVASPRARYSGLKVFNWPYDAELNIGGQAAVISPHLERATVAIFVFKNRVGRITWKELESCRNRNGDKRIPVVALFPRNVPHPDHMNSVEAVEDWGELLKKKKELTEDWDADGSRSVTPVEPYSDLGHLKELLLKRLNDIILSLMTQRENPSHHEAPNPEPIKAPTQDTSRIDQTSLDRVTSVTEYDSHAVQTYRSNMRAEVRLTFPVELTDAEFLRRAGYVNDGKLTAAGVLLFTSHPYKTIPSALIRCTKYDGISKAADRSRRNCDGPLLGQILEARDFIVENTGSRERPVESSMQARTIYQYPMVCVREMLANAVCHRDYEDQERITYVTIFTDRIEIRSPGKWVGNELGVKQTIPLSKLASESIQRNIRLAHAISSVDMMEMEGSGIPSSIHDCLLSKAPEPSVVLRDGYVVVTIYPRADWDEDTSSVSDKDLAPQHEEILNEGVELWNRWRKDNPALRPVLAGINLSGKHLANVDFSWANLERINLSGADLFGANFSNATLTSAALFKANLIGANFSGADFSEAQLMEANLDSAHLKGTIFRGANLSRAKLTSAYLNKTIFANTNLSNVIGLSDCVHIGPSNIDINTIEISGHLPEDFLIGCGLPEHFVVYVRSLFNTPIEFFSCFISYSSKDQEFAERIHADLQAKGVRVWFAPEDMRIGGTLRRTIDDSIRIYDKVLLILSEASVTSKWVEKEVETAMESEEEQKRTVLFPVRLDDTVMEIKEGWPADILRTRHIGDFRRWKSHDEYQQAFARLLADLKAST
jgi:uncharacterized protein YjbI with pentapeptide repeats